MNARVGAVGEHLVLAWCIIEKAVVNEPALMRDHFSSLFSLTSPTSYGSSDHGLGDLRLSPFGAFAASSSLSPYFSRNTTFSHALIPVNIPPPIEAPFSVVALSYPLAVRLFVTVRSDGPVTS